MSLILHETIHSAGDVIISGDEILAEDVAMEMLKKVRLIQLWVTCFYRIQITTLHVRDLLTASSV